MDTRSLSFHRMSYKEAESPGLIQYSARRLLKVPSDVDSMRDPSRAMNDILLPGIRKESSAAVEYPKFMFGDRRLETIANIYRAAECPLPFGWRKRK